ncbi:ATP-binding protein [Algoriphagus antarcticus]|uniref:histidine kinase n=1 Tax=Algoriphagus antarcticus TaxID=238540 RepID=A0A3E0DYQ1_9BACT|nr:ATP-binding protein [Algoriphagus antarcticus]REG91081.1 phospho-acceptor domain-containing protein [Algoriphagus antarcticus]
MKHKQYFKIFFFLFVSGFTNEVGAQQSRVDSIITMLQKTKSPGGVDSTAFTSAMNYIEKTTLNETTIAQLEKAGNLFINGANEYWSYSVKYSILRSLVATDMDKAITYGKYHFEAAKQNKTPNASYISSAFFKQLRLPYRNSNRLDEGFQYFNEKLKEYKINNDSTGLSDCYYVLAGFYRTTGLVDQAIYNMKKSVSYINFNGQNDKAMNTFANPLGKRAWLNNNDAIGAYYLQKGAYTESLKYFYLTLNEFKIGNVRTVGGTATNMAYAKILAGQLDSVSYFLNLVLNDKEMQNEKDVISLSLQIKAFYKIEIGALDEAEELIKKCWKLIEENNIPVNARAGTIAPDYYFALVRIKQNRLNEAIELLTKDIVRLKNSRLDILRDYKMLAALYEQTGNYEKANDAHKTFISLQDSLQVDQNKYRSLSFETEQEMNEKELSITKLQSANKISTLTKNFTFGIAVLVLLLAGVVYYRYKSKQKANKVLEATLANLKSTQAQLIQSEKMASLGEPTAGIAHEIQNPLNFVNNFSEVSNELIAEIEEERSKSKEARDETLVSEILSDIKDNLSKINHHGKRADAIVKSMLEHSKTGTGSKELTDLNKLVANFTQLAYQNHQAKDKTFEADFTLDLDPHFPKLEVIPSDIGKVILNLVNNAFYAVNERSRKDLPGFQNLEGLEHFKPLVTISTKNLGDRIEIAVSDNGPGIPDFIKEKIFQPFFTTKPTGQGTGLGLSLSYDIIKAHGGELKVVTKEGEGSMFIIQLSNVRITDLN